MILPSKNNKHKNLQEKPEGGQDKWPGRKRRCLTREEQERGASETRTPPPALLRAEKRRIVYTDNRVDAELYLII